MHKLSNFNELVAAVSEVNAKLVDATTAALASLEKQSILSDRVAELEDKLREKEDWESQLKRYKLHEFPTTKALAYALQPDMADGEPLHYLCATCLNKAQKTILQPAGHLLCCPVCNQQIAAQKAPPTKRRQARW